MVNTGISKEIRRVVIASNNQGKLKEFKLLFSNFNIEVLTMAEVGYNSPIVENGKTFQENAYIKAKAVFDSCKIPTIADDSGLEVDFLGGEPGVFSARYSGENASDEANSNKVLKELLGVEKPLRKGRFVCVIHFIFDEETEYSITGKVEGIIGEKPVGMGGFGYDPIFMVDDNRSMAMLSGREKNKISHRAEAFEKLSAIIKEKYIYADK